MIEVIIIIIIAITTGVIYFYNRLVKNRNFVRDAWAGIAVQLTKRHDLIPLLVKTVKAYSDYESNLLESVTELRAPKVSHDIKQTEGSEQNFGEQFSQLFLLAEAYPDIKADESFQRLQTELVAVESDIESARRYYNGSVRDMNILIESFPSNLVARQFDFVVADFFELRLPNVKNVPQVRL